MSFIGFRLIKSGVSLLIVEIIQFDVLLFTIFNGVIYCQCFFAKALIL